jgi:hypothetical protein
VIINLISQLTEENSASFSLNVVLDIFRYIDHINLPYVIVCMDRRINLFVQKSKISSFKSH